MPWLCAACRQQQVLFVLLAPRPHADTDALIIDDVGRPGMTAQQRGCLAGAIPLAAP
ncbi:hypothetical protein [Amycolatopsis vastitatis]|uniref:hypothetical protein n=1 Tax=Amycolatopsis vastitatis TaxID=1905142 RepID=UPI0013047B89|nr:hypothetical protein [Amycolatopsis vastitatis]